MNGFLTTPVNGGAVVVLSVALIVAGTVIIAVVKLVSDHFRRLQRDDIEGTLKIEMIERGMTAEDIEKVLRAQSGFSKSEVMSKIVAAMSEGRRYSYRKRRAMHDALLAADRRHARQ